MLRDIGSADEVTEHSERHSFQVISLAHLGAGHISRIACRLSQSCDACEEFKRMRTRMLSIPHDELLKSVARRIVDWHVLRLIKLWLKAPIEERDEPEVVGALSKRRFW